MANATYSITQKVESGTGDYGSDHKAVWSGPTSASLARQAADLLARRENADVLVFRGRDIGKLVYTAKAA